VSEGTAEGIFYLLGILVWVGFVVLIGYAALKSLAILFGVGLGRNDETDTSPPATAGHSWSVRLPDGDHRVEVRGDLLAPLLAWCDGVGTPLDWHGGYATFPISGHEGRLYVRVDTRVTVSRVAAFIVALLLRDTSGVGYQTTFDLLVEGGNVERVRDQRGVVR
jgi:hypothetical protein